MLKGMVVFYFSTNLFESSVKSGSLSNKRETLPESNQQSLEKQDSSVDNDDSIYKSKEENKFSVDNPADDETNANATDDVNANNIDENNDYADDDQYESSFESEEGLSENDYASDDEELFNDTTENELEDFDENEFTGSDESLGDFNQKSNTGHITRSLSLSVPDVRIHEENELSEFSKPGNCDNDAKKKKTVKLMWHSKSSSDIKSGVSSLEQIEGKLKKHTPA